MKKGEKKIMFYDYHMHCSFSPDSKTSMEKMIETSINLGLKEICFTDHMDYDIKQTDDFVVNYEQYLNKLELMQDKYKDKISIKKGIELGLQNHLVEKYTEDMNKYKNDFDFVLCSMHAIERSDMYYPEYFVGKTQHEAYETYYLRLLDIVKKFDSYSVLGHLDLVKRYGNYENILEDKLFMYIIEEILKTAIDKGKGIEVNTSCFRYNLPNLTPSKDILRLYKDLGGEIITTGSDSHCPSQIAYEFHHVQSVLKEIGFDYICKFDKMEPSFIKI